MPALTKDQLRAILRDRDTNVHVLSVLNYDEGEDRFFCHIEQSAAPHPGATVHIPAVALPYLVNEWAEPSELVGRSFQLREPS